MLSGAVLRRYGVFFCALYLMLFVRLHYPAPYGGAGILGMQPHRYLHLIGVVNPGQHPVSLPQAQEAIQPWLLIIFFLLFAGHFRLVHLIRRHPDGPVGLRHILGGAVFFSLPLILLPYVLSTDMHIYVFYGRMAAIYGANPAFTPPSAFPHDPFFADVYPLYRDTPSVYGPVWTLFSHGLTLLVEWLGGAHWLYLLGYKLSALTLHLLSSALLWAILGRWRPQQQLWGTLLYAWNPLALIEFAGSAHNDVFMICLILLGLWFAQNGRWRIALVALVLATLVKWIAVVMLPLYALIIPGNHPTWPARLRILSQVAAIVAGTAIMTYLPLGYTGAAVTTLTTMPAATRSVNSLSMLLLTDGVQLLGVFGFSAGAREAAPAVIMAALQWICRITILLAWLAAWIALRRRPTFARFVQGSCAVMLIMLLVTPWFWPWYVTWPLALAALLEWRSFGQAAALFAAASSFVYAQVYGVVGPLCVVLAAILFGVSHSWRKRLPAEEATSAPHVGSNVGGCQKPLPDQVSS